MKNGLRYLKELFLLAIFVSTIGMLNAQNPGSVVVQSVTTAETNASKPDALDDVPNDIVVLKTSDGTGDRESYVKFDLSNVSVANLAYASLSCFGSQHNGDTNPLKANYWVQVFTCDQTDWSREDLTWNKAKNFTIGTQPLATLNLQGFETYNFNSGAIADYISSQVGAGKKVVAFKFVAKEVQDFDSWMSGAWEGVKLNLSYSEPTLVVPSATTAETKAASPDALDDNANDVVVLKTSGGTGDRESYVKFDISTVPVEYLKFAVISCFAAQHNLNSDNSDLIDPNWVDMYTCSDVDWKREDLTWNKAKTFTIGSSPIASANIQGFATTEFFSPAIAEYIVAQKLSGAKFVAFKFVARESQIFDTWMSGAWEGYKLTLFESSRENAAIQDLETAQAFAGDESQVDSNRNDIVVLKTNDGSGDYESFVSFDITAIKNNSPLDLPSLTYASISFKAGQHNPDGTPENQKFVLDLYPINNVDWKGDTIKWKDTKNFIAYASPVASTTVIGFNDYSFGGKALAGYISSQILSGASKIAFKIAAREITGWDAWLGGEWEGFKLNYADPSTAKEVDKEKPSTPTELTAKPGETNVGLIWKASSDNVGVAGYKIYQRSELVKTLSGNILNYSVDGLERLTEYTFSVSAYDKAGNESDKATVTSKTIEIITLPIVIDGKLDADWTKLLPNAWPIATKVGDSTNFNKDFRAEMRMLWDLTAVYLYVQVWDKTRISSTTRWNDRLEIQFDPQNLKLDQMRGGNVCQLSVQFPPNDLLGVFTDGDGSWDNTWNYLFDLTLINSKLIDAGDNYVYEAKIPWKALNHNPALLEAGKLFGFDIAVADNNTGKDATDGFLAFYNADHDYEQVWSTPATWSTLELKANGTFEIKKDDVPPTVPGNLEATVNGNEIKLTWEPSTDNVGVVKYVIVNEELEVVGTVSGDETSFTIKDLPDGDYYYAVIAKDLMNQSDYSNVVSITLTSVHDISKSSFIVYPNPMKESVTVSNSDQLKRIVLTNISGQIVKTENVSSNQMRINTSDLKAGVYLLNLYSKDGNIYVMKLIK